MKAVEPDIIPGRPPITDVKTFMIQVAWRALAGFIPAMIAAVTASGIWVIATGDRVEEFMLVCMSIHDCGD